MTPITPNPSEQRVFPPDSVMWRVCRERATLLYGPAAAVMQVAHPKVGAGVAQHSRFQHSPLRRLVRTLDAVYAICFGTHEQAEQCAARLAHLHAAVRNAPGDEIVYFADDPELLMWVLATLVISSVDGYVRTVGPLSDSEKQQFYLDMRTFGTFFNLPVAYGPRTWEEFIVYYETAIRDPQLGAHPISKRTAWEVAQPSGQWWLWLLARPLRFIYSEVLPYPVRERLGFRSTIASRAMMGIAIFVLPRIVPWLPSWLRYPKPYRMAMRNQRRA